MLKKILGGVALALALFLGFVATRPAHYRVERGIAVGAPADAVYAIVSDLRRWEDWSPWDKLDPSMRKELGGTPGAPGSTYRWSGNDKVGEGRMTLVEASAPTRVSYRLEFLKPFASVATTELALAPEGTGTKVTWSMAGDLGFAEKLFTLFVDMNGAIGKDFDHGLATLKEVAERGGAAR